jgi:L-asparaginase/Glu-tRNA(Gln) amidotransferase subunit D
MSKKETITVQGTGVTILSQTNPQGGERLVQFNSVTITQMKSLVNNQMENTNG